MATYGELHDRVVLVTGAARGLGRAIAEGFAAQGSRLALVDIDGEALRATAADLGLDARRLRIEIVDLADSDACAPLVERVCATFGRLDVLVNNAAIISRMPLEAVTAAEFEHVLRVDLLAPFFLTRAALAQMRRWGRGGRIVNVASMAGRTGGTSEVYLYAAAKGGLLALTRSLARVAAADGILINAILPSNVDSPMLHGVFPPAAVARTLAEVPLGRAAQPSEVAELVLWLASDASSYVTGASWDINGGWYMT